MKQTDSKLKIFVLFSSSRLFNKSVAFDVVFCSWSHASKLVSQHSIFNHSAFPSIKKENLEIEKWDSEKIRMILWTKEYYSTRMYTRQSFMMWTCIFGWEAFFEWSNVYFIFVTCHRISFRILVSGTEFLIFVFKTMDGIQLWYEFDILHGPQNLCIYTHRARERTRENGMNT